MWKALWQKWTIDKPAALGDWLWDVLVMQVAAFLNRLTWRQIAVFIPLIVVLLAYYHNIPVSPGLMLLGDLLAYIDIFSMLLLLGLLSRATTILFVIKQVVARVGSLGNSFVAKARQWTARHRRERGAKGRPRLTGRSRNDEDEPVGVGLAWA